MELSILLAKIIGLILTLVALTLLLNRKNIYLLFDIYKNPGAVFLTGLLEIFLGITFVLNHNIWTRDYRTVITIIGWMLLLRGLGRTFFPSRIPKLLKKFRQMHAFFTPLLIFILAIGLYLTYMGFTK